MYRIAHFSDFHLANTRRDFARALVLLDDAIARRPDHIVLTGDIVDAAEMHVLARLMDELNDRDWSGAGRLTLVPGNHDAYPVTWPPRHLPRLWRRMRRNLEAFHRLVEERQGGKAVPPLLAGESWPFGKVLADDAVLVGLNTVRTRRRSPLRWAEGELLHEHAEAIKTFFQKHGDTRHRIVAMHHPPWFEHYRGNRILNRNFGAPDPETAGEWIRESGATLVLCGHTHREKEICRRWLGRSCLALRAGSAGGKHDRRRHTGKLRVYHTLDLLHSGRRRIHRHAFHDRDLDALLAGVDAKSLGK